MVCQDNEILLNNVLIGLARSFLQYVAECWPWVKLEATSIESQVQILAARQRQDVAEIVDILIEREHSIDFGSFPTEYTDLHFISLESLLELLHNSMSRIATSLQTAAVSLRTAGDTAGADLLAAIEVREHDLAGLIKELSTELQKVNA